MNPLLAATIMAAVLAATPGAVEIDVAKAYEDVRVIRRVASISGDDLPEKLLDRLIEENVERLRGRVDERNYSFARWVRSESSRTSESSTIKKEKDGRSTIAEITATSAYRLEITAPSRRYLAARNRPLQLDSVIAEYTTATGARKTEQFDLRREISPGESTGVDFAEIGWNVTARLKAEAAEASGGHGTVELALLAPTLTDNSDSPWATPTANMLSLKGAVRDGDVLEIRRLCDATTFYLDEASSRARSSVLPVGGFPPMASGSGEGTLFRELQEIEDLLTGDEQGRRDGMDRLHQLIIRLRP